MTTDLEGPDSLLTILSHFAEPLCCDVEIESGNEKEKYYLRYDIEGTREGHPWFCLSLVYFPANGMMGIWTRTTISRKIEPGNIEPTYLFNPATFEKWLRTTVLDIVLEELTKP